jgi:hypothetical protein
MTAEEGARVEMLKAITELVVALTELVQIAKTSLAIEATKQQQQKD